MEMPQLVQAAAIGVPDLAKVEAIYIYAITTLAAKISEKDVLAHCRMRLPRAVMPSEVRFVEHLPLNPNGKVVRATLRQMAQTEYGEQPCVA